MSSDRFIELRREAVDCALSLASAIQQAGGRVCLDHLDTISLKEFITEIASQNGIRFVYEKPRSLEQGPPTPESVVERKPNPDHRGTVLLDTNAPYSAGVKLIHKPTYTAQEVGPVSRGLPENGTWVEIAKRGSNGERTWIYRYEVIINDKVYQGHFTGSGNGYIWCIPNHSSLSGWVKDFGDAQKRVENEIAALFKR